TAVAIANTRTPIAMRTGRASGCCRTCVADAELCGLLIDSISCDLPGQPTPPDRQLSDWTVSRTYSNLLEPPKHLLKPAPPPARRRPHRRGIGSQGRSQHLGPASHRAVW